MVIKLYCRDCKKRHYPYQMYRLKNRIWKKIAKNSVALCISCFQKRLGRKLTKEDFTKCKINEDFFNRIERRLL